MGYICTRCGGTNVACEAIVNPNTGKIIDYFDGSFMHAICSNCENNVIYYPHTNTLSFNWNDYGGKITQEEFDDFVNNVDRSQLPEGIKFELK